MFALYSTCILLPQMGQAGISFSAFGLAISHHPCLRANNVKNVRIAGEPPWFNGVVYAFAPPFADFSADAEVCAKQPYANGRCVQTCPNTPFISVGKHKVA